MLLRRLGVLPRVRRVVGDARRPRSSVIRLSRATFASSPPQPPSSSSSSWPATDERVPDIGALLSQMGLETRGGHRRAQRDLASLADVLHGSMQPDSAPVSARDWAACFDACLARGEPRRAKGWFDAYVDFVQAAAPGTVEHHNEALAAAAQALLRTLARKGYCEEAEEVLWAWHGLRGASALPSCIDVVLVLDSVLRRPAAQRKGSRLPGRLLGYARDKLPSWRDAPATPCVVAGPDWDAHRRLLRLRLRLIRGGRAFAASGGERATRAAANSHLSGVGQVAAIWKELQDLDRAEHAGAATALERGGSASDFDPRHGQLRWKDHMFRIAALARIELNHFAFYGVADAAGTEPMVECEGRPFPLALGDENVASSSGSSAAPAPAVDGVSALGVSASLGAAAVPLSASSWPASCANTLAALCDFPTWSPCRGDEDDVATSHEAYRDALCGSYRSSIRLAAGAAAPDLAEALMAVLLCQLTAHDKTAPDQRPVRRGDDSMRFIANGLLHACAWRDDPFAAATELMGQLAGGSRSKSASRGHWCPSPAALALVTESLDSMSDATGAHSSFGFAVELQRFPDNVTYGKLLEMAALSQMRRSPQSGSLSSSVGDEWCRVLERAERDGFQIPASSFQAGIAALCGVHKSSRPPREDGQDRGRVDAIRARVSSSDTRAAMRLFSELRARYPRLHSSVAMDVLSALVADAKLHLRQEHQKRSPDAWPEAPAVAHDEAGKERARARLSAILEDIARVERLASEASIVLPRWLSASILLLHSRSGHVARATSTLRRRERACPPLGDRPDPTAIAQERECYHRLIRTFKNAVKVHGVRGLGPQSDEEEDNAGCALTNVYEELHGILARMEDRGVPPTSKTFAKVMGVLTTLGPLTARTASRTSALELGLALLRDMQGEPRDGVGNGIGARVGTRRTAPVSPCIDVYAPLLALCVEGTDSREIGSSAAFEQVHAQMIAEGVPLDVRCYASHGALMARHGDTVGIDVLLEAMSANAIVPDAFVVDAAVRAHLNAEAGSNEATAHAAEAVMSELCDRHGINPARATLAAIHDVAAKGSDDLLRSRVWDRLERSWAAKNVDAAAQQW